MVYRIPGVGRGQAPLSTELSAARRKGGVSQNGLHSSGFSMEPGDAEKERDDLHRCFQAETLLKIVETACSFWRYVV